MTTSKTTAPVVVKPAAKTPVPSPAPAVQPGAADEETGEESTDLPAPIKLTVEGPGFSTTVFLAPKVFASGGVGWATASKVQIGMTAQGEPLSLCGINWSLANSGEGKDGEGDKAKPGRAVRIRQAWRKLGK